jgi:hypothetical protein
MLAPLRRSVRESLLDSATHCKVCIRRIHAQNAPRGAAAAQVQVEDDFQPFVPPKSRSTKTQASQKSSNASVPSGKGTPIVQQPAKQKVNTQQQFLKQQTKSSQQSSQKKGNHGRSAQPKVLDSVASAKSAQRQSPLLTATHLDSRHVWDRKLILSLYPEPTEEKLPSRLNKSKSAKSYSWKADPAAYLELGLRVGIKVHSVPLASDKKEAKYRVLLTATWQKDRELAVGDGSSKVKHFSTLLTIGNCQGECRSPSPP